jgi:hypothetical protein
MGECVRRWLAAALFAFGSVPAVAETPVERGGYLVNSVMACNGCHTPRGPNGPDLARMLSGGSQQFDEPAFKVMGSNITPDRETGIGAWTDTNGAMTRSGEPLPKVFHAMAIG